MYCPQLWVWWTLHTEGMYPYHTQHIQHLEPADICSRLELCHWINSNLHMICNILFTNKAHFTRNGVNNTRNSHLWDRDNQHGTVKSNYQHLWHKCLVWCQWWPHHWSVHFPATSDRWYLCQLFATWTASLQNVPLQTRWQMYCQHEAVPPHFSQVVRQDLNHKLPNCWTGRGSTQNWPPQSPDLNPFD